MVDEDSHTAGLVQAGQEKKKGPDHVSAICVKTPSVQEDLLLTGKNVVHYERDAAYACPRSHCVF